jgi:Immunity protein 50
VEDALKSIPGAAELVSWFGRWPSFHDAEVINLTLNRSGVSTLKVHTWEMTSEIDGSGYFILRKHVLVTFLIEEILSLDLTDFNQQNVIFGLDLSRIDDGFQLRLDPCYGVSGTIAARKISVEYEPMPPSSAQMPQ